MPETEVLEPTTGADEAQTTVEVPDAPAGDAPSAPVVETGTTEPAAPLATRQRGPDGRFIKADGTQATEAEHAAIEQAAPPASPPAPVTPPPATPTGEPFVFKADGQRIPIQGALLSADGHLTIPAEQVPAIRQLLAEGVTHRGSWRKERETFQAKVEEAGAVESARAEKYNRASMLLWDKITNPEWLQAAVADPREVDILRRELGIELQRADLKAPRKAEPAAPEVDMGQLQAAAEATLADVVEEWLDTPQGRAVYATPEDRQAATAWYKRHLNTYALEQNGEVVIDTELVKQDFEDQLKLRRIQQANGVEAKKAKEFNDRRNVPPVVAPPVVSPRGPGGSGPEGGKTFKTREEWLAHVGMG